MLAQSTESTAIRVVVVDKQPIVRLGLESLLESDPMSTLVGTAADIDELNSLPERVDPDILIFDPWPDGGSMLEELMGARDRLGDCKIIVYTSTSERCRVVSALEMGIRGYLLKQDGMDEVVAGIHKVYEGCAVLSPDVADKIVVHMTRQHRADNKEIRRALTERELEVLAALARGQRNRAIAKALYICEATVKFHVHAILAKLAVANRTEAVLVAAREGLIDLDADARHSAR